MTILQLTGKADKRVLAYPLMKICALAGKTVVLTDDITYRRLYEGHEDIGQIHNIEINIVRTLSGANAKEAAAQYEMLKQKEEYDYLIYITDYFISDAADAVIGMCEQNKTFEGWSLEELFDQRSNIVPCILSITPKDLSRWESKNLYQIPWNTKYINYIIKTEELRRLLPIKDKRIIQILYKGFGNALKMTPTNLAKVAGRRVL